MTVFETERLSLRKLTVDDAEFILTLLNEPAFLRYIGDKKVRNLEDARQYILTGPVASYERYGFGLLLVELKESHTPIGMCGLLKREELPIPTSVSLCCLTFGIRDLLLRQPRRC